jgi:hypothetical protein
VLPFQDGEEKLPSLIRPKEEKGACKEEAIDRGAWREGGREGWGEGGREGGGEGGRKEWRVSERTSVRKDYGISDIYISITM